MVLTFYEAKDPNKKQSDEEMNRFEKVFEIVKNQLVRKSFRNRQNSVCKKSLRNRQKSAGKNLMTVTIGPG